MLPGWMLAAGCGLVGDPEVVAITPTLAPCGGWSADVEVTGMRGRSVELRFDGATVRRWDRVWGHRRLVASGFGAPYEPAMFEAAVVDAPARQRAQVELLGGGTALTLGVEPVPDGAAAELEVAIYSNCPLDGAWWRLTTGDAGWTTRQDAVAGEVRVSVPAQPRGAHPVQVELFGPASLAGRPLAADHQVLVVGELTPADRDGDDDTEQTDCDDTDPTVHSAAEESANGRDDDCDGAVDEGTDAADDDGDGRSERDGDCDDADARVYPEAAETANCRDDDCDGTVDDGVRWAPQPDDPYEGVDGVHRVAAQMRELQMPLRLVSRDRFDEERIAFASFDGLFDLWGIDVVASRLPARSAYAVDIDRADGARLASGVLRRSGDAVRLTGSGWSDDSGDYEVRLRPLELPVAGCPVELYLEAR